MIRCNRILKANTPESILVMEIHDELVFEIRINDLWILPQLTAAMEDFSQFGEIPITVDTAIGQNFFDMQQKTDERILDG